MNFDESEQTILLRETLRRFLDKELPSGARPRRSTRKTRRILA
jgi:hypothetical protein